MDEGDFREVLKAPGNMEIHLDQALVDRRIFPTISIERSGTRKEGCSTIPTNTPAAAVLRPRTRCRVPGRGHGTAPFKLKGTPSNIMFLLSMGATAR